MDPTEVIGGGNIEPRELEEEMRTAFLDYAMCVIVGRALPDVRDGLKPVHRRVLFAMNELGLGPTRARAKCAAIVGEVMGNYPPARRRRRSTTRSCAWRRTSRCATRSSTRRATSAPSTATRRPPMRYTEARLVAHRDRDAARPRHGHGRLRAQLRRLAPGAARCCRRASRTCSSTAPRGSPSAWRRTSRRTTCARWSTATIAYIDDPEIDVDGLLKHVKGPDFPTGGIILGRAGHPRGVRDRARPRSCAGARPHRAAARRQGGDHRHRAALHGQEGRRRRADHEDRRPRQRRTHPRDRRPRGPARTSAACGS